MIPPKHDEDIRIVTFNVCSIKNVLEFKPWNEKKTFKHMFDLLNADIVCFQETKVPLRDLTVEQAIIEGYDSYFVSPSIKRGYSGVAFYVRKNLHVTFAENGITGYLPSLDASSPRTRDGGGITAGSGALIRDLPSDQHIGGYPEESFIDVKLGKEIDAEGRAIVLDVGHFVIIGLYCPANSMGDKQEHREAFFEALDARVRALREMNRQLVVLGDLNVTREIYDSADALKAMTSGKSGTHDVSTHKSNFWTAMQSASSFEAEFRDACARWRTDTLPRRIVNKWIADKLLLDTTRLHHSDRMRMYTCWNLKVDARPANFGSRLDYILTSGDDSTMTCTNADILPDLFGSDHCPVFADFCIGNEGAQKLVPYACARAGETGGVCGCGSPNDPPRLCTKYLPQFCGKQQTVSGLFSKSAARYSGRVDGGGNMQEQRKGFTPTSIEPAQSIASNTVRVLKRPDVYSLAENQSVKNSDKPGSCNSVSNVRSPMGCNMVSTVCSPAGQPPRKKQNQGSILTLLKVNPRPGNFTATYREIAGTAAPTLSPTLRESTSLPFIQIPDSRQGLVNRAKTQWDAILSDKTPFCHHREKCKILKTKKNGPNKGREFWACARPTGDDGVCGSANGVGEFRCSFFQWLKR